jgi:hypothetical protein
MSGTLLGQLGTAVNYAITGERAVDHSKQDRELLNTVAQHLVCVTLHEEIGDPSSRAEEINVLIVEGDQNQGIGVVMSEPVVLEPKARGVFCGDIVEWVPGPGKIGRITQIVTPDFEMGL